MRRVVFVAGLLAAIAIAIGVYFAKFSNQSQIVIAQVGDFFLYAPVYIAKDAGYFERQGLDVRIISTGGDEKSWAAVVSGSAQFGIGDPTFVAISAEKGQPGVIVASIVNGVPFWGITLRSDIAPVTSPPDLNGYTVATFPAPSTAYTLQRDMFNRGGLEPKIRQGAFGALLPMLRAGQADIALELEPNVSSAVHDQKAKVVYSLAREYGDFAITGLAATPEYVRANADTVRRTVCALRQALDHIRIKPDDTLALLAVRFPGLNHEVAKAALGRVSGENIVPKSVSVGEQAWNKAIQLRLDAGDLSKASSMSAYVNNTFAQSADAACQLK